MTLDNSFSPVDPVMLFQCFNFFLPYGQKEGFKMFPSFVYASQKGGKIDFPLDKTIKTFASCFGAHFIRSLLDVNSP